MSSTQSSLFDFEENNAIEQEAAWRSETILRRLYVEEEKTTYDIAERLGAVM